MESRAWRIMGCVHLNKKLVGRTAVYEVSSPIFEEAAELAEVRWRGEGMVVYFTQEGIDPHAPGFNVLWTECADEPKE